MRDPFVLLGPRGPRSVRGAREPRSAREATGAHDPGPPHDPGPAHNPAAPRRPPRARDRPEFWPLDVWEIRRQFHMNRRQFADMLGISSETLRNWETGRRWPQGSARALLRIARADPDVVAAVLVRSRVPWGRIDD